jgi:hypothetical protein
MDLSLELYVLIYYCFGILHFPQDKVKLSLTCLLLNDLKAKARVSIP